MRTRLGCCVLPRGLLLIFSKGLLRLQMHVHNVAPRTSSRSRKNDDFDLCVDNELGFAKDRTVSRYVFYSHLDALCVNSFWFSRC